MSDIELLRTLVSINSVFPNEQEIGEFLESQLKKCGFETRRLYISENRSNVLAERGSEGEPFLLYGHMDTVPPYGEWVGSPFELREDGERLHGLGAYDMKAGLAAILRGCEVETDRKIKVAFGVGEENNSEGSWAIVKDGFLKDVVGAVVPEINDGNLDIDSPRAIMIGRRGRAVYEISVPGRAYHAAQVEKGVSAITEAARLALELDKANQDMPGHECLPKASQFIRKIYGETQSLSLPDEAIILLDRHMVTPETPESVLGNLQSYIDSLYEKDIFREISGKRISVKIKERETPYLEPYVTSRDEPVVQKLASAVRENLGEPVYAYGMSVADESVLSMQGIPVAGVGPLGGDPHSNGEWLDRSGYVDLIRIMRSFMESL
jgi:acetylornithine deacetylase/succinyl-diaminopimelate desuccinylase-like protein